MARPTADVRVYAGCENQGRVGHAVKWLADLPVALVMEEFKFSLAVLDVSVGETIYVISH